MLRLPKNPIEDDSRPPTWKEVASKKQNTKKREGCFSFDHRTPPPLVSWSYMMPFIAAILCECFLYPQHATRLEANTPHARIGIHDATLPYSGGGPDSDDQPPFPTSRHTPRLSRALMLAPWSRRSSTTSGIPLLTARWSGVILGGGRQAVEYK